MWFFCSRWDTLAALRFTGGNRGGSRRTLFNGGRTVAKKRKAAKKKAAPKKKTAKKKKAAKKKR